MKRVRLTPTLLALALLCFCLPWIEVRCDAGTISQTGFQLARGNWTYTPSIRNDAEPAKTSEPDGEKSDANAAVHGASVVVGLSVALMVHVFPWRQLLLAASTSSALVCLGLLTRRVYADATDEIQWEFTVWFFAAWVLNAAALGSVIWEFAACARGRSSPVGDGEPSGV